MAVFDPQGYWEARLTRNYTLDGVGYIGLSEAYNAWMYRVRRHVFLRRMRSLVPDMSRQRVLDVGSGTGFYIERWHELGAGSVTGSDLTDVAVRKLREKHPGDAFVQFDAGGNGRPFEDASFSLISMVDVLYHIVDDANYRRAFDNVFALLQPGGHFVFSENFLHRGSVRLEHQASRSLTEIEGTARAAGFEVVDRRPVFALMNAPIDAPGRVSARWWELVRRITRRGEKAGAALGAVLYPFELGLVRALREGPSTELMVCRRPDSAS
jgi:SAM-dependent methyltransferase